MKTSKTVLSFIESHLNQLWLITPACARLLYSRIPALERQVEQYLKDNQTNPNIEQKASSSEDDFDHFLEVQGGLAILHIEGVLSKHSTPSRSLFGNGPPTYPEIAGAMRFLQTEENVEQILIRIESPGGGFFGLKEAADAVFETRSIKPITVFIDDRASSAAYWLASQADRIIANPTAQTPSIGTFAILVDTSEQDKMFGLDYILISSGGIKGSGADGKVNEEYIEDVQRQVNEAQAFFNADVARGRPELTIGDVEMLADGREYFAAEAIEKGLVDEIENYTDTVMSLMPRKSKAMPTMRTKAMFPLQTVRTCRSSHSEPLHDRIYNVASPPLERAAIIKPTQTQARKGKPMPPELKDLFIKAGAPASGTDEEIQMWALEEIERQTNEIERLRPLAKEGEVAKTKAIELALEQGKRAKGDKFEEETWKARLQRKSYDEICDQADEWKEIADDLFGTGRKIESPPATTPEPEPEPEPADYEEDSTYRA